VTFSTNDASRVTTDAHAQKRVKTAYLTARFDSALASGMQLRRSVLALLLAFPLTNTWAIDVASQSDWNTAMASVASATSGSTVTINVTSGFTLTSSLAAIQASAANVTVNINGAGAVINGSSAYQGLVVQGTQSPVVTISNLGVINTVAKGGNGIAGQNGYYSSGLSYGSGGGGGGGLGAGGGLLVGSGASVTLSSVTFTGNAAQGGNGGNGGSAQNTAPDSTNGGNGGAGGASNNGGATGGGGSGGTGGHTGTQGTAGSAGTSLGDGGGGGGGSGTTSSTSYTSNNSGGAGNANGGNGGTGGDGVTNNGGSGGPGTDGGYGGAGGAARGGAIYVATGGSLTILDTPITGATVAGGSGGSAGTGQGPSNFNGSAGAAGAGLGGALYLNGVTANIGVSSGTVTYANTISGTGLTTGGVNSAVNKTGAGTLVLSASNDFTGNVNIVGGTLSIAATGNLGNIANDVFMSNGGTLAVTGTTTLASGRAIFLQGASTIDVANSTTTTVQGVIADGASAGSLAKSGAGTLTLSGVNTYTGTTTISGGSLVLSSTGSIAASSGVVNDGSLDISGTTAGAVIKSLSGTGAVLMGGKTLTLSAAADTFSGTLSGTGGLVKQGTGTQVLNGSNTYTGSTAVQNGALVVGDATHASAAIAGAVTVSSGATVSGFGSVGGLLTNNGTVMAGSSAATGTLTAVSYVQDAGAAFRTSVASDSSYGKLAVSGTASLPSNAKIDVNVIGSPAISNAKVLSNVISASTLTSDGTFVVTDNSALYDFLAVKNGNAVDLCTVLAGHACVPDAPSVSTGVTQAALASGNFQGLGAAQVLDSFVAMTSPTGDLSNVVTALGGLSTQQEVSDAVRQTLPLLGGGSAQATNNVLHGMNRIIQSRMDANRGLSSGDDFMGDRQVWAKPFGAWATQNSRDGFAGFDSRSQGMVIGADSAVSARTRVGAAFTYARTHVDGSSGVAPQSTQVDTYQLAGYGTYNLDAVTDIDYQVDLGKSDYEGNRTINFGGLSRNAKSSFDSWSAHAGAGLGRLFMVSDAVSIVPAVRLDYTKVRTSGYTESGADSLNLAVDAANYEELLLSSDAKVSYAVSDKLKLLGSVAAGYDLVGKQAQVTSTFVGGGPAFVTKGVEASRWLVRAGLGVQMLNEKGLKMTVRYDAEYRTSGFLNQSFSAHLSMPF
jgi:autotransporter-associated beta strand protein